MMLFSLHSRFVPPAIMPPKNKFVEYLANTTPENFSLVSFIKHFAFKDKLSANAAFIAMVNAIWTQPQHDQKLIDFSQNQIANQFAILKSKEVISYWVQEDQKSIDIIQAEVEQKQQKLNALEALEKINKLVKEKEEALKNEKKRSIVTVREQVEEKTCVNKPKKMHNQRTVDQETELTAIAEIQPVKKEAIEPDIKQSLASAPPCLPSLIDDLGMTSFLASLRPVPGSKKWTYENRDMVKAWTIFKAKCAGATIDRGISIKDDIQSLLALSHIFYIKSSDNSQIMNDYFQGPNKLFGIRQDVRSKIGLEHQYTFQGSAQLDVIKTIENLLKKNTGKRKIAASEVLNIAVNLPEDEYLILSELVSMINYLPRRPVTNVADQHCITEYANPILRPIFENVNAKRKLKWIKKDTLQQVDIQAQVHLLSSQSDTSPLSIGKVTHLTGDTRHDKLKISADLIQLAIDSKKNIDAYSESSIRDVTFFHVVGFKVTIYIMSLLHEGLYAMLDIAEINIPQSIEDLVPFVNNLEASITASRVFKHCSSKENKDIVCKDYFRPTLSTRKFDQLVKPLPSPTKRTF